MEKSHNSLYRTYRPSTFNDVAGHKNIVEILTTELKNNAFGHAYLFAGQRGTGKTSMARIFAKAVNCTNLQDGNPCDKCKNCIAFNENNFSDIYEIDAASNNGVDEIRNIKNNISTLPIVGDYKVYIIDEVHMLTKGAFNALLKTLEEPPMHAIFILATTEYDKIPQTIISRCQTFGFKKISNSDLKERINFISKNEGYILNDDAANEIYSISEGSLRDALNILEQLMVISNDDKKIDINKIKKIFYIATKEDKINIIIEILNKESVKIIEYFESAKRNGMDFDIFSLSLIKIIKEIIEFKITNNNSLLEEINVEDAKKFNDINILDLFNITDNLTEAYIKTKNNNASFDYILLSILKSIKTTSGDYKIETNVNKNDNEITTKNIVSENETQGENIELLNENTIIQEEWEDNLTENLNHEMEEKISQNNDTNVESLSLNEEEIQPKEKLDKSKISSEEKLSLDDYSSIMNESIKNDLTLEEDGDETFIHNIIKNNEDSTILQTEETEISNTYLDNEQESFDDKTIMTERTKDIKEETVLVKNQNDLYELQTELSIKDNSEKEILYLANDLINVLLGVLNERNPELRHELNDKLNSAFELNENNEFMDTNLANALVSLFDSKIVTANSNEIIIQTDTLTQASLINKTLTKENIRTQVFDLLGKQFAIFAISKNDWAGIKNTFSNLKSKNRLPEYEKVDINEFYKKNNEQIQQMEDPKNKELLEKASEFFDIDDIEIGD